MCRSQTKKQRCTASPLYLPFKKDGQQTFNPNKVSYWNTFEDIRGLIKQFRELFTGEAIIGLNRPVIKAIAIDSAVRDAGTTKQSVRPIF